MLYVLDVSGSADFYFVGTSIGDVNNDGLEDTRLDAEIAAFIALNDQLITQGLEPTFRRLVSKVNNIFGKRKREKTEYVDVQGLS